MSFNNIQEALQAFLSNDNQVRIKAEEFLNQIPKQNFEEGINQFLAGMDIQDQQIAALSAVYLKKKYLDDSEMISKLNEQQITNMVTKVQASVNAERSYLFLQRSFEILVKLLSFAKKEFVIMDLIKNLSANSQDSKIKKSLMYLIEITCEYSFDDELLIKYSQDLSAIFTNYLEDSDINVRVASFKGLTIFLASINNETLVKQFSGVFPILISKCIEALKEDSESGLKNLESLVELCETHPKFVRPILNELVNLFTEVLSNNSFDDSIRIQAFNGISVLCQTSASQMRKSDIFKTNTVKAIMVAMTEIENIELEEWNKELNDELLSQQHPSIMAVETLGKIAPEIGVKKLLPLFIGMIKEAIQSSDWKHQHAGLMGISMLSEGCKEVFSSELDNIFQMVHSLSTSTNPRIISALLKTYSLLAEEFSPEISVQYGDQILPYIIQNLSHELLKVQYTSVQSLLTFARSLQDFEEESKIVAKHAQSILTNISTLFQKAITLSNNTLLEEVLTCLSVVAHVMESEFASHYNSFMPGLQSLLDSIPTQNQEQINLRVLTLESIGYLISSIKKNKALFQPEATKLMQVLLKMSEMYTQDDAHHSAIYVVMGQIAEGLGQEFSVYVQNIFDRVIKSIEHQDIAKIDQGGNGETASKIEGNVYKKNLDLGMYGNFNIELNHTLLEQKMEGAHLLFEMCKALGKQFFPYVEKTLACITQFFSFQNSVDLRQTSIKTLQYLLLACESEQQMAVIMNSAMPQLLKELTNSIELKKAEMMSFVMEQIGECLKHFTTPLVELQYVEQALTKTSKALEVGEALKKEIRKSYEDEEMDEELQEELDEEIDEVNAIMRGSIEVIGSVMKTYNTQIEGIMVNALMPHYFNVLQNKSSLENEVFNALYVFDTLLEFCSQEIYDKAYSNVIAIYTGLNQNETYNTPDILQNICCGYGVFAKRSSPQTFNQNLDSMLKQIQSVLENPKSQEADHLNCTESAIGAIGRFALFQLQDNQQMKTQMMTKFLESLPLKHDEDEAQQSHLLLLQETLNKNPALFENEALLKSAISNINNLVSNNPETQILCQQGKQLLTQVLNN